MPTLTLSEIDAFPGFSVAIEDTRHRVPDHLRATVPDFLTGTSIRPFLWWEPVVCFARLAWWN